MSKNIFRHIMLVLLGALAGWLIGAYSRVELDVNQLAVRHDILHQPEIVSPMLGMCPDQYKLVWYGDVGVYACLNIPLMQWKMDHPGPGEQLPPDKH